MRGSLRAHRPHDRSLTPRIVRHPIFAVLPAMLRSLRDELRAARARGRAPQATLAELRGIAEAGVVMANRAVEEARLSSSE